MSKMAIIFISFLFLCASVAGQEPEFLQISSLHHHDSDSFGVAVELKEVSASILMAENWLRFNVLSRYPSTNITTIVVSDKLLFCDDKNYENQQESSRLTRVAMENVHHSLVRWGLEKKIKVSVFITYKCLHQSYLKPVFQFLEEINSTYTVKTHDENLENLRSGLESMADLSVFRSKKVNVMSILSEKSKPTSRKLSFVNPESEVGYSVPSDAANAPLPPLIGVTSPPPISLPFTQPPLSGPMYSPPPPHYGLNLPPCNPYANTHHRHRRGGMASPPVVGGGGGGGGDGAMAAPPLSDERLWCVAKPSVPSEKLQEGMDYACGEGGADCEAISPTGSCYFPDSIVAHASYAFNSYWQKNKKNGGTCGFGGTAMLISSDPSFLQCHFTVE